MALVRLFRQNNGAERLARINRLGDCKPQALSVHPCKVIQLIPHVIIRVLDLEPNAIGITSITRASDISSVLRSGGARCCARPLYQPIAAQFVIRDCTCCHAAYRREG